MTAERGPIGEFVLRMCAACERQTVYALPEQPAAEVRCHGCVVLASKRRGKK
jgi:ribosomal protein S27E